MPDADLLRRLDAALSTRNLHPAYARALLRECRTALQPSEPSPARIVLDAWAAAHFGAIAVREDVPPGELWFEQDGKVVARFTGLAE